MEDDLMDDASSLMGNMKDAAMVKYPHHDSATPPLNDELYHYSGDESMTAASHRDVFSDVDDDMMQTDTFKSPIANRLPESSEQARDEYLGVDHNGFHEKIIPGKRYFLVVHEFMQALYEWFESRYPSSPGCPIDNSPLVGTGSAPNKAHMIIPKEGLVEKQDYSLVSEPQWNLLMEWFGGGPAIDRVAFTNSLGEVLIDLYGVEISIQRQGAVNGVINTVITRDLDVNSLKRRLCNDFFEDLDPNKISLLLNGKTQLGPKNSLMDSFDIHSHDAVVVKDETGAGAGSDEDPMTTAERAPGANQVMARGPSLVTGAVGLSNLGNTCFMNSSLQCLSNVPQLREYFVSGAYKNDINVNNALGSGGKLAMSFGDLLSLMWTKTNDVKSVSPVETKRIIGANKPQFQGYHQHDSQELITSVLDLLHEDLNRVLKKPLTSEVESDGKKDDFVVAAEAKRVFHLRNESYINDLTEGYLKNTVRCPACNLISVKFDQCTCLTLPVAQPSDKQMCVAHIRVVDSNAFGKPLVDKLVSLRVPADSNFGQLRLLLATQLNVNPFALIMTVIWTSDLQFKDDSFPVSKVTRGDEIFVFVHEDFVALNRFHLWKRDYPALRQVAYESAMQFICPGEVWIGVFDSQTVLIEILEADDVSFSGTVEALGSNKSYSLVKSTVKVKGALNSDSTKLVLEFEDAEAFKPVPEAWISAEMITCPGLLALFRYKNTENDPNVSLMTVTNYGVTYLALGPPIVIPYESSLSASEMETVLKESFYRRSQAYAIPNDQVSQFGQVRIKTENEGFAKSYLSYHDQSDVKSVPVTVTWEGTPVVQDKSSCDLLFGDVIKVQSKSGRGAVSDEKRGLNLYECLELFSLEEQLSASNAWYCSQCKASQEAFKRIQVWSLPRVLVIHLKRFSQSVSSYFVDKDDSFVEYPLEGLDLSDFVLGNTPAERFVYDLAGVSHHYGGLGGGHYTATCRNSLDGSWCVVVGCAGEFTRSIQRYEFDDSSVTFIGASAEEAKHKVCSSSGYVLFYIRRQD